MHAQRYTHVLSTRALLGILVSLLLAFAVAACGAQETPTPTPTTAPEPTDTPVPTPIPESEEEEVAEADEVEAPAADEEADEPAEPANLVELVHQVDYLQTLALAIETANLSDELRGEGPFTVFAPSDEAFAALPGETQEALLTHPDILADVLLYHTAPGRYLSGDLGDVAALETLQGAELPIIVQDDGTIGVDHARVVATDMQAPNAVIHVIDSVLLTTASSALREIGLIVEPLPEDANIVDFLEMTDGFETLVSALETAGLNNTLKGEGPFTIFAATNEAFDALPEGRLEELLDNPAALAEILRFHVVREKLTAADLLNRLQDEAAEGKIELMTLQGSPLEVTLEAGEAEEDTAIKVDEAGIASTDLEGSNGVIHAIDAVVLPPGK